MILFMKDKTNFPKRLINKQVGFVLEKMHIVVFEVVLGKIAHIFDIIDEKIIQNISLLLVRIFNYIISLFVLKITKTDGITSVRNILIIFAIFAIVAIFIALFGGFKC